MESKDCVYTAGIAYDAERIRRLSRVQYSTFRFGTKLALILIAILLILAGILLAGRNVASLLFLAAGSILLVSVNFPAHSTAEATIRQYAGKFPSLSYRFSESGLLSDQVPQEYPYSDLIRLIEDRNYLYLYINTLSAFMVERSSVSGDGGDAGLRDFLAEKTGLSWTKPPTLFNLNLKSLRNLLGQSDQKPQEIGERLPPHR